MPPEPRGATTEVGEDVRLLRVRGDGPRHLPRDGGGRGARSPGEGAGRPAQPGAEDHAAVERQVLRPRAEVTGRAFERPEREALDVRQLRGVPGGVAAG